MEMYVDELIAILTNNQKKRLSLLKAFKKNWCPARDLNPHACALDPKSSVSANFTSGAHLKNNLRVCSNQKTGSCQEKNELLFSN